MTTEYMTIELNYNSENSEILTIPCKDYDKTFTLVEEYIKTQSITKNEDWSFPDVIEHLSKNGIEFLKTTQHEEIELNKFEIVGEEEIKQILENLVMMRFKNKQKIRTHLKNCFDKFNKNIKISKIDNKLRYDDEKESDFNLIGVIENKEFLCDIDIYYLKDNRNQYFITEIGYEFQ